MATSECWPAKVRGFRWAGWAWRGNSFQVNSLETINTPQANCHDSARRKYLGCIDADAEETCLMRALGWGSSGRWRGSAGWTTCGCRFRSRGRCTGCIPRPCGESQQPKRPDHGHPAPCPSAMQVRKDGALRAMGWNVGGWGAWATGRSQSHLWAEVLSRPRRPPSLSRSPTFPDSLSILIRSRRVF